MAFLIGGKTFVGGETKAHHVSGWSWIPGFIAREAGPSSTDHNHVRRRRVCVALRPHVPWESEETMDPQNRKSLKNNCALGG